MLSSCVLLGVLAKTIPWLYEVSAFGIWIAAFSFFAAFFIKEIHFFITMRKGKCVELSLDRLTKHYGRKIAADQASAVLEPGVYGFLGANGA